MGWGRLVRMITIEIQKQRDRRSKFLVTGLSVLLILYMPLTVRCFRFFQCVPIDDKNYLLADFREECYTSKWNTYATIAIFVIVFYCMAYPLCILKILFSIRHNLEDLVVQHKYSFLYSEYKLKSFWWEPASIFRKFLLSSVPVFLYAFPTLQLVLSIYISMVFHLLHATWHPFVLYQANILQHLVCNSFTLTVCYMHRGTLLFCIKQISCNNVAPSPLNNLKSKPHFSC